MTPGSWATASADAGRSAGRDDSGHLRSEDPCRGGCPGKAVATFVAGLVLLVLFVVRQLRMPLPMINARLIRVRAFTEANRESVDQDA